MQAPGTARGSRWERLGCGWEVVLIAPNRRQLQGSRVRWGAAGGQLSVFYIRGSSQHKMPIENVKRAELWLNPQRYPCTPKDTEGICDRETAAA